MTLAAAPRFDGTGPVAWLARAGLWQRLAVACLAGAAMTAGHAPLYLPWGYLLAVPVAFWLVDSAPSARGAALMGWGVGFGYFVTGLHWIGHAFLVDPERHAWMLPFALTLLPGFLALFWAAAFWAARRLWTLGLAYQSLALAACWTIAEMLRGHILTGFPWALPAYAWVGTPILQNASWAGPYGLSFLVLLLTVLPLSAVFRRKWTVGVLAAASFAGLWVWGAARVPAEIRYPAEPTLVRIVQPNAPQDQKWDPDYRALFYERLLTHTAGGALPDVVLWPETAVPFLPSEAPEHRAEIAAAAGGAPVVMGALDVERHIHGYDLFNALLAIMPDGAIETRYDKHHLVPFGEYLPLGWLLEPIGLEQIAMGGGFTEGPGPQNISVPGVPPFAAAICYEMIFPSQIIGPGPRPDWIVTITNDAWFGGFAGPQQHLDQARFRAVEQGLPVARAANTGISAMIDPYGRVIAEIRLHQNGALDSALPAPLPQTIYGRFGDLPIILLLLTATIVLFIRRYS